MKTILAGIAALLMFCPIAVEATIGVEANIRFSRITLTVYETFDCAYDSLIARLNRDARFLSSLNDRLEGSLAAHAARIDIQASSDGHYGFSFHQGNTTDTVTDCQILRKAEGCVLDHPIDPRTFYQAILDHAAKKLGQKGLAAVGTRPLISSGYTLQLGVFSSRANAIRFARQVIGEIDRKARDSDREEQLREEGSFCRRCLINEVFGDGWAFPPVSISAREGKWFVQYGVFLTKADAEEEATDLKKLFSGEAIVFPHSFGDDVITTQIDHRWVAPCT